MNTFLNENQTSTTMRNVCYNLLMLELFHCRSSVAQLFLVFEKQIPWLLPVSHCLCALGCVPLCHLSLPFPAAVFKCTSFPHVCSFPFANTGLPAHQIFLCAFSIPSYMLQMSAWSCVLHRWHTP